MLAKAYFLKLAQEPALYSCHILGFRHSVAEIIIISRYMATEHNISSHHSSADRMPCSFSVIKKKMSTAKLFIHGILDFNLTYFCFNFCFLFLVLFLYNCMYGQQFEKSGLWAWGFRRNRFFFLGKILLEQKCIFFR